MVGTLITCVRKHCRIRHRKGPLEGRGGGYEDGVDGMMAGRKDGRTEGRKDGMMGVRELHRAYLTYDLHLTVPHVLLPYVHHLCTTPHPTPFLSF